MGSDIDLETGQAAQVTPRAGEFFHALITLNSLRSVSGSRGRSGKSRDARNGYPWASHEQGGKLTAVGSYWPKY